MSHRRTNFPSGAKWEDLVGYSRAVKIGNLIEVSGTVAVEGDTVLADNPYDETLIILGKIEQVLKSAGADLRDVIRTRIYVTDISQWEAIGRAHGKFFANIKPATSMVQVAGLIDNRLSVEIEATAVIPTSPSC